MASVSKEVNSQVMAKAFRHDLLLQLQLQTTHYALDVGAKPCSKGEHTKVTLCEKAHHRSNHWGPVKYGLAGTDERTRGDTRDSAFPKSQCSSANRAIRGQTRDRLRDLAV